MLRRELERLGEIALEVGDALARDPVDQVERDVVEAGAAEGLCGGANTVGARAPLERFEQVRLEALCPERNAIDTVLEEEGGELRGDRLGVRLDRRLGGGWESGKQSCKRGGLRERRCAAAEEDGLDLVREQRALELQFCKERVDVATVLPAVPSHRHEVAVAAAVRAEREMDVKVARARSSPQDGGRDAPFWNGTRQLVSEV